jgi:Cft2 family RNA processing exonuclease
MEIHFLGGSSEIGASSAIVQIGANRVLVDCGVRMTGYNRLPDLAAIDEDPTKGLDAVIITHAHTDHTGALPVFHQTHPTTPIYATTPTVGLVEVLFRDSIKIMQEQADIEDEIPLYSLTTVLSLLDHMIPVSFNSPVEINGLRVTWVPGGHILGASMTLIEGTENGRTVRVMFSGDISVDDQLTVPGAAPELDVKPDVFVVESTYGDRLHSPRQVEEQRLIESVRAIIERKGKLLIPAFAIGRAQEVALIFLRAFRNKALPPFPVWLDGMVRSVCGIYSKYPVYQTPFCRTLIERYGNPFLNVVDEIKAVSSGRDRNKILAGEPCAIIASSGMLSGGASSAYAPRIAADGKNAIFITGYQDEESPGRHLLDLASGEKKDIRIGQNTVQVDCQVDKYSLSAHADANQIAGLIEALKPEHVVLVHGGGRSRPALADLIRRGTERRMPIHLPRTGETVTIKFKGRKDKALAAAGGVLGQGRQLDATTLPRLVSYLANRPIKNHSYSVTEMLDIWYGAHAWTEDQYNSAEAIIANSCMLRRHPKRPQLYDVKASISIVDSAEAGPPDPEVDAEQMVTKLKDVLGDVEELYHVGYNQMSKELRLSFSFPEKAIERYKAQLEEIVKDTGWAIHIRPMANETRLAEVALECLPEGLRARRNPSLHLSRRLLSVLVDGTVTPEANAAAMAKFVELTGYNLELVGTDGSQSGRYNGPKVPLNMPAEMNTAFRVITKSFMDLPQTARPYRTSLKAGLDKQYIELAFLTPIVGKRCDARIAELSRELNWEIRIKPEPNAHALMDVLSKLIPAEWRAKAPGLFAEQEMVRIKGANVPPESSAEWEEIAGRFLEVSGYKLIRAES